MRPVHLLIGGSDDRGGTIIEGGGQKLDNGSFVCRGGGRQAYIFECGAKGVVDLGEVADLFGEAHRSGIGTKGVLKKRHFSDGDGQGPSPGPSFSELFGEFRIRRG